MGGRGAAKGEVRESCGWKGDLRCTGGAILSCGVLREARRRDGRAWWGGGVVAGLKRWREREERLRYDRVDDEGGEVEGMR